jgi:hypothetical protein
VRALLSVAGGLFLLAVGLWLGRWSAGLGMTQRSPATLKPVLEAVQDDVDLHLGDATDLGFDVPPPSRAAGFLTLTTNLPARVYLDGALVRRRTPLDRYPVRPGFHIVLLEALATQERREITMNADRGREDAFHENFQLTAPVK